MNIYNLKNRVVVDLQDLIELIGDTSLDTVSFSVYGYESKDCLNTEMVLSGPIPDDFMVSAVLPDGKYQIALEGLPGELGIIEQDFYVLYNKLPKLVEDISDIFCNADCTNCSEDLISLKLNKIFFETNLFLSCTGLGEELVRYKKLSCELNEVLNKACEYEKYFGNFKFDYEKSIKDLLATFLIEVYVKEVSQIRLLNTDITEIDSLYNIKALERCLYTNKINMKDILCDINNAKCNCDE